MGLAVGSHGPDNSQYFHRNSWQHPPGRSLRTIVIDNWKPLLALCALFLGLLVMPKAKGQFATSSDMEGTPESFKHHRQSGIHYQVVEQTPKLRRFKAMESTPDGDGQPVSVHQWITMLQGSPNADELIDQFTHVLKTSTMKAFFFETNGISWKKSHDIAFEFVLVESDYLYSFADAQADPSDFADKLNCATAEGCVFPNLGGDSTLIAPKQIDTSSSNIYGHLAAFVRRAPPNQVRNFWKLTLRTVHSVMRKDPNKVFWFSTDGTGVKWLHMRMDPRPKYYSYQPFAHET